MIRRSLLALAALAGAPAFAASTPPAITVANVATTENAGSASLVLLKTKASSYSKVTVQTVDGTARAGVDYVAVNATYTLGNSTSRLSIPIRILDNATYQGERKFSIRLTVVRFAQIAVDSQTPPTVTISDDEPPPSAPSPLTGAPAIADNFDYASAFEPTTYGPNGGPGIPGTNPLTSEGAYRFFCRPGQLLKDDPIVYPGQPGKSHLHLFIGNTGANASSTYETLRTTGGSTCDNQGQSFAINRSSYWTPAMLDGTGHAVLPDYVLVYYKRFPKDGPGCVGPMALGICTDLPNGLRFIFGYDMKTMTGGPTGEGTREYWSMSYGCWGSADGKVAVPQAAQARFHTIADIVKAGCPVGARLHVGLDAPTCWNGRDLDTADHRSHMVYAPDGTDKGMGYVCPADHPYLMPTISYQWLYTVDENFVAGKWALASDAQMGAAGMDVIAGTTLHMDYFEAWSTKAKSTWFRTCINGPMSCSSGDQGDGTAVKGMGEPAQGWKIHQLVPAPGA
jgi:hypothetical protein